MSALQKSGQRFFHGLGFFSAMHTPLIIRAPGMRRAGARCDALVDSLDLYSTLVEAFDCGLWPRCQLRYAVRRTPEPPRLW